MNHLYIVALGGSYLSTESTPVSSGYQQWLSSVCMYTQQCASLYVEMIWIFLNCVSNFSSVCVQCTHTLYTYVFVEMVRIFLNCVSNFCSVCVYTYTRIRIRGDGLDISKLWFQRQQCVYVYVCVLHIRIYVFVEMVRISRTSVRTAGCVGSDGHSPSSSSVFVIIIILIIKIIFSVKIWFRHGGGIFFRFIGTFSEPILELFVVIGDERSLFGDKTPLFWVNNHTEEMNYHFGTLVPVPTLVPIGTKSRNRTSCSHCICFLHHRHSPPPHHHHPPIPPPPPSHHHDQDKKDMCVSAAGGAWPKLMLGSAQCV